MALKTNGFFVGAAGLSVCVVVLALCGPLTPFGSKAGFAPWFESEVTSTVRKEIEVFHRAGSTDCSDETTTVTVQYSMYGYDYTSEISCSGAHVPDGKKAARKVTRSEDLTKVCDKAATDGMDSFCAKRKVIQAFFWLTVVFALVTCGLSLVAASLGKLALVSSIFGSVASVVGFALGAAALTDLKDHYKSVYDVQKSVNYEVQGEAAFHLAWVTMVLAFLVVPLVVCGLMQLRKAVAKPAVEAEKAEEAPTLLVEPSTEEEVAKEKEVDAEPAKPEETNEMPKEAPKVEEAVAPAEESNQQADVEEVVVIVPEEAKAEEEPVDENVLEAIHEIQEEDRLARLATLELEHEREMVEKYGIEEKEMEIAELQTERDRGFGCATCLV